jgi:HD domain
VSSLVESARHLAEACLASLPRRWSHVQAVGAKAERLARDLCSGSDAETLAAAAWLHDIGYGPSVVDSGFHPLDGGRWLRREGYDGRVAALVAHHSCAHLEASERGLASELTSEFLREEGVVADALWYADMTTGPDGQDFDVTVRLGEIQARYGPTDAVTRFIIRAEPEIVAAVRRTEDRRRANQPI